MNQGIQECLDNHPAPNRTFETALNQGKVTAIDLSVEKVGVSAREIGYQFNQPKSKEAAGEVAENLVRRVDYLLEPLAIIERDQTGSQIQIRSRQPSTRTDGRRYYEVNVDRQGLNIRRFHAAEGSRNREEIHLTRESFERLCHDLDDLLPPAPQRPNH